MTTKEVTQFCDQHKFRPMSSLVDHEINTRLVRNEMLKLPGEIKQKLEPKCSSGPKASVVYIYWSLISISMKKITKEKKKKIKV